MKKYVNKLVALIALIADNPPSALDTNPTEKSDAGTATDPPKRSDNDNLANKIQEIEHSEPSDGDLIILPQENERNLIAVTGPASK